MDEIANERAKGLCEQRRGAARGDCKPSMDPQNSWGEGDRERINSFISVMRG